MQMYVHWHSDMFSCFEACFVITPLSPSVAGIKIFEGGWRESAVNSRQMGALSRDRMDEEYRQNSRRSDCPTSFPGKVPRIRDKWVHFPGTKNENGGKVYQKRESISYLRLISDVAVRKSGCRQFYNKLNISTLKTQVNISAV